MALSAKCVSFLFLLTLFSSLHIHARESQFFSKVTTNNNNNNAKVTEVPNKEEPLSKQEQEPSFIPETQNGYGLFGHESGQLPPTTTTTTNGAPYTTTNLPYKTETEELNKVYPNTNTNTNTNNNYYKEAYVTKPQGMSDTRFMDRGYTTPTNANNYYNGGNSYNTQQQGMGETRFMDKGYTTPTTTTTNGNNYYNGGNNYNTQKQGMSDTRFLENGRYFYDPNGENNYRNEYVNSRGVDYKNKGYYGNNENSYEYNNSMEGYQNQEEYKESQDGYMP